MEIVNKPLIIVYREDENNKIKCAIWPPEDYDFRAYGLIIADVIRHTASAFGVPEQSVFDWVKKEMKRPTTELKTLSRGITKQ